MSVSQTDTEAMKRRLPMLQGFLPLDKSRLATRAYALRYRDPFNQNADLVGLCLANAAAGCNSTFIVNGSPTKTAMVDTAGGRSQIAHLTTAAMVTLVLLFLTKPLSYLPNAVLAAIVFLIGVKLIDYRGLAEIRRKSPREFRLALATAATVVLVGVEQGIILSLLLSLLRLVRHSYEPHTAVILHDAAEHTRMEPVTAGKLIEPGLVMFWFGADLFYANVYHFAEQALMLVTQSPSPVRWLVVDAGAITGIDYSAGRALKELQQDLAKQDVVLALARVCDSLREDMDRHELTQVIGVNRLFESRRESLEAYQLQGRQSMATPPKF